VKARLRTLRSLLGDTLQIPEVRTAIDILGEMACPDPDSDVIDEFVNCPLNLLDQIVGMRSFEAVKDMKDMNADGWPSIGQEERKDTFLEGYYMTGALPTDTNTDGSNRQGRFIGVGSDNMGEMDGCVRDKADLMQRRMTEQVIRSKAAHA
jgi:hypothetical protein